MDQDGLALNQLRLREVSSSLDEGLNLLDSGPRDGQDGDRHLEGGGRHLHVVVVYEGEQLFKDG